MPRLTLRLVVGALCACLTVIVAAVTLAITYSVSIATVRDIGRGYARGLTVAARVQVQDYFDRPVLHMQGMALNFLHRRYDMPPYDPQYGQLAAHDKYFDMHFNLNAYSNFTYVNTGLAFEDGSGSSMSYSTNTTLACISRFAMDYPRTSMQLATFAVDMTTGLEIQDSLKAAFGNVPPLVNYSVNLGVYQVAKQLAGNNPKGMWYPTSLFAPRGEPILMFPAAIPFYNSSRKFIGMGTLAVPIDGLSTFLKSVKVTPGTEVFALDSQSYILAGSTSAPTSNTYIPTDINAILPTGCATTKDTNTGTDPFTFVNCRYAASAFAAYPALQSLARSQPDFLMTTGTALQAIALNGDNYFVVVTQVPNAFRFWGLQIVLFLPENDILGDIVTGRNTAIGITAAVCIVSAAASFMLVFMLLRPLNTVSRKMLETARLKDSANEEEFSSLAEIRDLQKAYSNMNTAIKSFTRYVPRDVVKELMNSGQMCTINMIPQRCSMLFVDIAGFTTICERVPPDVLSNLVKSYFDQASRIVMDHDGLIDKYIGDCIMAVWGAPFATPNQEVKATLTAKLIDRETIVRPLSQQWDEAGEQLRVRVGVSTGVVLAGNMGSEDRMSYTVIGDPVNLAARLESMNKQFGTRVMVSEMTAEELGHVFVLRLLLPIAVVGKAEPVKVYEVMGLARHIEQQDVDRLTHGEQLHVEAVRKGATDSMSFSESMAGSNSSANGGVRRGTRTTLAMIRDAQLQTATTESTVTASEDETVLAAKHTDAVLAYMRKDFRGALNIFASMDKNTPPHLLSGDVPLPSGAPLRSNNAGKSVGIVRGLCEEYLVRCPEDFDGVFKALEK